VRARESDAYIHRRTIASERERRREREELELCLD